MENFTLYDRLNSEVIFINPVVSLADALGRWPQQIQLHSSAVRNQFLFVFLLSTLCFVETSEVNPQCFSHVFLIDGGQWLSAGMRKLD